MKKMIENVIPFPVGCETSRFFGAISSMHMVVQNKEPIGIEHEYIFHVLYAVSGAGVFRLHQSNLPHGIRGYDANEMNSFIFDYISYSIRYLGYDFKKLSAGEASKGTIWTEITASIQKNIPVLFKVSNSIQWNLVCGYDENMSLYGLDAKNHYDPKDKSKLVKPDGYIDNGYFCDLQWYDSLEYVLICSPATKTITLKSALLRMCSFFENNLLNGFNANVLVLNNDDNFFANQSNEYLQNLYTYIDYILGYLMECSHHVSEAFGAVWKKYIYNPTVNPQLQDLFSRLDSVILKIQETVNEHWNNKPENDEKYTLLKHHQYRITLLNYFNSITEDDQETLELIRQAIDLIDDRYIDESI